MVLYRMLAAVWPNGSEVRFVPPHRTPVIRPIYYFHYIHRDDGVGQPAMLSLIYTDG